MKKSLLIASIASLVVLAGCGPTKTDTTVVNTSWTNVSVVNSSLVSWAVVVTETTNTITWTQTTTVVSWNASLAPTTTSVASLASVASVANVSQPTVVTTSSLSLNESLNIINNTKFTETNCEKIKNFMACSIKAITWDNQVLAANQMALQLKEMTADSARSSKCDAQYNMLKSSPELANFEQQVNCKLQ